MAVIKCPSCGTEINVAEKKSGVSGWVVGCLVAVCAIPVVVAIIGILAAIAIPNFVKSREMSQRNACVANMRMIGEAKAQVEAEKSYAPGDVISEQEVSQKLPKGLAGLICHKGGRYTINPAGKEAACSVHGTPSQATKERARPYGSSGGNRSP
jgi:predicted Zn finger-like uncharacterized protein